MVRSCHQAPRQMVPANRQDSEVAHHLSLYLFLPPKHTQIEFLILLISHSVSFSLTPTQLYISLYLHLLQSIFLFHTYIFL